MAIYAVMKTGGKQYRVAPGDVVKVERLAVAPGATVEISEVFLLADEQDITVGNPTIANARVVAEVIEEGRDKKIIVFKKKRRKGYQRTIGHRQYFTTLRINAIAVGDNVYKAAAVSRTDAPKTIKAAPAPPRSTQHDQTPPPAAKSAQAPKVSSPKEAAPIKPKPDVRDRDAVTTSTGVPDKSPAKPSEPIITARETISPVAPPSATPAEAPRLTEAAPPIAGTDHAPIMETPTPSAWEEKPLRPETPPIRQPEAADASAPDKRWYWLAAALAVLLLAGLGFLLFGDRGQRPPEDAAPVTVQPEQAAPSKPKPKEVKIKKPTAGAAPSAPVQPPD